MTPILSGIWNLPLNTEFQLHRTKMKNCQRTCEVNRMDENRSFTLTCYVKTVPVYDLKLVWVVLHRSVKVFFKTIHQQDQNDDVLFIVILGDLEISFIYST